MRKVEYICQEEVSVIEKQLATNGDPVELARNIGIARLSQFVGERLSEVTSLLKDSTNGKQINSN
jgi:hypothetical protein